MILWPNGKTTITDVWWEYGPRDPIWTDQGWTSSFHYGIDIGWKEGRDTYAPVTGRVINSSYNSVFGNRIIIREDATGDDFWICHLDSRAVELGQRVSAGQYIGYMGQTGKASGNHWHYEVHPAGGAAVNPRTYYANRHAQPHGGGTSSSQSYKEKDMANIGYVYNASPYDLVYAIDPFTGHKRSLTKAEWEAQKLNGAKAWNATKAQVDAIPGS